MVIQFTLQGLMVFLVCAFGIVAVILSIPILWNIKKVVGILRSLLETNQEFINTTLKTMPEIFENAAQISSDVRVTTDKLKISIPLILQETECITNVAKENVELASVTIENIGCGINETIASYKKHNFSVMPYFQIFAKVLQIIFHTSNK